MISHRIGKVIAILAFPLVLVIVIIRAIYILITKRKLLVREIESVRHDRGR